MTSQASARPRRGGAREALVRTFQQYRDELVSTLYFLLGNLHDAQDAAQDAFVKCWRRRTQLYRIKNVRAWLFRVGLNAARDLQRNAWRRRWRPLDAIALAPPVSVSSPADALVSGERQTRLHGALLQLRTEEKQVFLLRQNADLTYDEIASVTARPVGTVKTQMRSALIKLRGVLRD
jgi:RNA polymerase sigma-70 factor (ECF subfamily)